MEKRESGTAFDHLARAMAEDLPRREALRRLGGGLAGLVLTSLGLSPVWAQSVACGNWCNSRFAPGRARGRCASTCDSCQSSGGAVCGAGSDGTVQCVDLASNTAHCGACGHTCGAGETCVQGACVGGYPTCSQPSTCDTFSECDGGGLCVGTIGGGTACISDAGFGPENCVSNAQCQEILGTPDAVCLAAIPGCIPPICAVRGTFSCFIAGTRVTMADGSEMAIEQIRAGDQVLGAEGEVNRVIEIERPLLAGRRLYSLNGSTPFVTAEHPFMTEEGWKAIDPDATARENPNLAVQPLRVGDLLVVMQGARVPVAAGRSDAAEPALPAFISVPLTHLESRSDDPGTTVYNLLLDGGHTYFADGFLVHNKSRWQVLPNQ